MKEQVKAMDNLMYAMRDSIKEFVKSKGGFIRIKEDNLVTVITFNDFFNEIGESDVTALAVFDNYLYISHDENITYDENSNWRLFNGDNYVMLQTIYQLAKELFLNNY